MCLRKYDAVKRRIRDDRDSSVIPVYPCFSELSGQLKYATQKRIMLEVALIKLCTPAMETKQDTILERIRAVEEKVEKAWKLQQICRGRSSM